MTDKSNTTSEQLAHLRQLAVASTHALAVINDEINSGLSEITTVELLDLAIVYCKDLLGQHHDKTYREIPYSLNTTWFTKNLLEIIQKRLAISELPTEDFYLIDSHEAATELWKVIRYMSIFPLRAWSGEKLTEISPLIISDAYYNSMVQKFMHYSPYRSGWELDLTENIYEKFEKEYPTVLVEYKSWITPEIITFYNTNRFRHLRFIFNADRAVVFQSSGLSNSWIEMISHINHHFPNNALLITEALLVDLESRGYRIGPKNQLEAYPLPE